MKIQVRAYRTSELNNVLHAMECEGKRVIKAEPVAWSDTVFEVEYVDNKAKMDAVDTKVVEG